MTFLFKIVSFQYRFDKFEQAFLLVQLYLHVPCLVSFWLFGTFCWETHRSLRSLIRLFMIGRNTARPNLSLAFICSQSLLLFVRKYSAFSSSVIDWRGCFCNFHCFGLPCSPLTCCTLGISPLCPMSKSKMTKEDTCVVVIGCLLAPKK